MATVMDKDVVTAKDIKEIVADTKATVTNAAEDMGINLKANKAVAPVMANKAEVVHQRMETSDGAIPIPRRLHSDRAWWRRNVPKRFLRLFQEGLLPQFDCGYLSSSATLPQEGTKGYIAGYNTVLGYVSQGVGRKLAESGLHLVRFEVPWFVIPKRDSDQWRFITTNLRQINRRLRLKKFSLDTWKSIFPMLKQGQYCCKIDLKDAYFHVPLSQELQHYVCVRFGSEVFQFLAMPFGISIAPQVCNYEAKRHSPTCFGMQPNHGGCPLCCYTGYLGIFSSFLV